MRIVALKTLRAADLPPLEGDLGTGLVALVGSPEDAAEARRALVWAVATGEGTVAVEPGPHGATVERLWGATGGLGEAVGAAVGWIAGPALARVEAARAALGRTRPRRLPADATPERVEEALLR